MRFSFGTWKGVDQEGQLKTDKMKIEGIFFFGYLLQADFLILFPALYVHVSRGTAKYKIISTELGTCVIPIWCLPRQALSFHYTNSFTEEKTFLNGRYYVYGRICLLPKSFISALFILMVF